MLLDDQLAHLFSNSFCLIRKAWSCQPGLSPTYKMEWHIVVSSIRINQISWCASYSFTNTNNYWMCGASYWARGPNRPRGFLFLSPLHSLMIRRFYGSCNSIKSISPFLHPRYRSIESKRARWRRSRWRRVLRIEGLGSFGFDGSRWRGISNRWRRWLSRCRDLSG